MSRDDHDAVSEESDRSISNDIGTPRVGQNMQRSDSVATTLNAGEPVHTGPRLGYLTAVLRSKRAAVGGAIMVAYIGLSALAPVVAPHDPAAQDFKSLLKGPSRTHLLGTDELGRDILSRVIFAGRDLLYVGFGSVLLAAVLGTGLGMISAYGGGVLDALVMRLVDLVLGFPALIIGVMIAALRGPGSTNLLFAIAIHNVPVFVRLARSLTLGVLAESFVEVAIVSGTRALTIVRRHIFPNIVPVVIVQVGIAIPSAILLEAGLAFLGLGARPPAATIGGMLGEARPYLSVAPWFAVAPGLVMAIVVTSLNLMADGVRDLLDPRWSKRVRTAKASV